MRLLVITHTFPPSRHSNAKRPHFLVQAFLKAGWHVDVITSPLGLAYGTAESVVHPALRIRRWHDPVDALCRKFAHHPSLWRAFSLAVSAVLWPDVFVFWSRRAFLAGVSAAGYDRVLVFILPASLLLSGVSSGLVGRHWIFDYQESVTPHLRQHPRTSPLHRAAFPVLRKLEGRTLHKAGRVIFTSDTNRRAYLQEGLVKESATAQIPYFFDAEIFRAPAVPSPQHFQIVYPGNFDWHGARTPETFLRSLARFLEKRPEARPRTNFLFHGAWLQQHNRFIEELKLRDVVSIQPPVAYDEYIRKLKASTVLLLVVSAEHNLFMPSKIVDYFGARRPILAFVPGESEMRRVLESAGFADFANDEFDVGGEAAALERLWDGFQAGTLAGDLGKSGFWSSEVQIPRYLEIVLKANEPV